MLENVFSYNINALFGGLLLEMAIFSLLFLFALQGRSFVGVSSVLREATVLLCGVKYNLSLFFSAALLSFINTGGVYSKLRSTSMLFTCCTFFTASAS